FQGARYSIMMDTLINDFLTGEIEHAVVRAWEEQQPDAIVIEGQGSLLNPAYPGGYEILAAARPDVVVLQHAPARRDYDGFPGYPIQPLPRQIAAVEMIGEKPVVAVTINHEEIDPREIPRVCDIIERTTGLPTVDVLTQGPERLTEVLISHMPAGPRKRRPPSAG
ncbi:MAG: NAD-dependent epimerase/dehydratase family protein, partial [bacterium]